MNKYLSFCKIFRFSVFWILILFSQKSFAQDSILKEKKWILNGYVKEMQTLMFVDLDGDWMIDNLIHNRLNFKWYPSSSTKVDIEIRNRFMFGDFVKSVPGYSKMIDNEKGFIDLSALIFDKKSFLLHSTIDRAYFDWNKGKFQFRFGRQRINWAHTFVWNPNDLFNTYSFFDFDYEEKPGSDAVRITYYTKNSAQLELAVKAEYKKRITSAFLYKFNKWAFDFQILGGVLNGKDLATGIGWSGHILKSGFRAEASYFHPIENFSDSTGTLLAVIGLDYAFNNSMMIQFEALYNSAGKKDGNFNLNEFYYHDLSAKTLSLTQFSLFSQVSYPFTPLLNGTISCMYSPNDQSVFIGPAISYSLADDVSFSFSLQNFQSKTSANQGGKGNFAFIAIKKSF